MNKIPHIIFEPNKLQHKVWEYIESPEVTHILFGGAAASGKSYFGCLAVIIKSLTVHNIKSLICRTVGTQLSKSTKITFFNILDKFNFKEHKHYSYNKAQNIVRFFATNSEVLFLATPYLPSDPDYDYLGSMEATLLFFDEAAQTTSKCIDILTARLRYNVHKQPAKVIMSCNPTRNWVYTDYVLPYKNNKLDSWKACSLGTTLDNAKNLDSQYLKSLQRINETDAKRLFYGDWEYSENINQLFSIYTLEKAFNFQGSLSELNLHSFMNHSLFVSIDVSGGGTDYTVVSFVSRDQEGMLVVWKIVKTKESVTTLPEIVNQGLEELKQKFFAPTTFDIIYDSIGVGYNLEHILSQYKYRWYPKYQPFKGSEKPVQDHKNNSQVFLNKRAQAYYDLSQYFANETIIFIDKQYKEEIQTELINTKLHKPETNDSIQIIPKDDIKKVIGRSPDISDSLSMAAHISKYGSRAGVVVGFHAF